MLRALILLFALPCLVFSSSWDHFEFDITFFCNYADRKTYSLKIEWWEQDTVSKMEQLSLPKLIRPPTGRHSFTMEGAMDKDEWFSDGYKSIAYISHDCTDDHKRVDLELTVDKLCEIGHNCHYRIIKDITNTWGKEVITPTRFEQDNMDPFPDFP